MSNEIQTAVVFVIVAVAAVFSIWRLLPRTLKKKFTAVVQRSEFIPASLREKSVKAMSVESGCGSGCSDCSPATPAGVVKEQPIRFVAKHK